MQPTRCGTGRPIAPAWPCSRWGLPGRSHRCARRWSLTPPFHPRTARFRAMQYTSLWHSAVESPRLAFRQHRTLWRADFPQAELVQPAVTRLAWTRSDYSRTNVRLIDRLSAIRLRMLPVRQQPDHPGRGQRIFWAINRKGALPVFPTARAHFLPSFSRPVATRSLSAPTQTVTMRRVSVHRLIG